MDQEKYLRKRMNKALKIADELNFMIEHTLGVSSNLTTGMIPILSFHKEEDNSQGKKLFQLMKDFLDLSLQTDDKGEYPEEIINKYLDDMSEFSLNPRFEDDVLEFNIQDHVYKIELVMGAIVSMTLLINDEWIQTRVIRVDDDYAAIMRILDLIKKTFNANPYMEDKPFNSFYNNIVKVADEEAPGWRNVERKVFVPYKQQNDIYISPYNSEEFMKDLIDEIKNVKRNLSKITNHKERKSAEFLLELVLKDKGEQSEEFFNFENLSRNIANVAQHSDVFHSEIFQDMLKSLSKKHNVLSRLKQLIKELKTFSDVKPIEEHIQEAEDSYGYDAVKKMLLAGDKDNFLDKAGVMTQVDSVALVDFIATLPDKFFMERADIFLELMSSFILPLQPEHIERISSVLSSDPVNLLRKINPDLTNEVFGDKEYGITQINPEDKEEWGKIFDQQMELEDKFKSEKTTLVKDISTQIIKEMEDLEAKQKVKWEEPIVDNDISDFHKLVLNKAMEKLADNELFKKILEGQAD